MPVNARECATCGEGLAILSGFSRLAVRGKENRKEVAFRLLCESLSWDAKLRGAQNAFEFHFTLRGETIVEFIPHFYYFFHNYLLAVTDIQRSAKKYATLAKQDPGRARQNR